MRTPVFTRLAVTPSTLLLAALTLGGSPAAQAATFDPSLDNAAANYTAPTTVVPSDTLAALDAVLGTTLDTGTASPSYTQACPGGGSVTVTITGTPGGLANGVPDAGETYQLNFSNCMGTSSGVINGAARVQFTLAGQSVVEGVSTQYASGLLILDMLSVTSPAAKQGQRLGVGIHGQVAFNYSEATKGSQTTTVGIYGGEDVAVAVTNTAGNEVNLTIQSMTMARQVLRQSGAIKQIYVSGEHALVTSAGRTLSTSIDGAAQYSSTGNPVNGVWTLKTKGMALKVTVASGTATVEVDKKADGSIDRTFTLPVSKLVSRVK